MIKISKTGLLIALLIVTLGSSASFAFASLTPQEFSTRYSRYINLFGPGGTRDQILAPGGPQASGLTYNPNGGLITNNDGTVTGFVFNLGYKFTTPGRTDKWHWDRLSKAYGDDSHTFLIRVCEDGSTEDKCWVNSVPFTQQTTIDDANYTDQEMKDARIRMFYYNTAQGENYYNGAQVISIKTFQRFGDIYNYNISTDEVPSGSVPFQKGKSFFADAWYCAGNASDPDDSGEHAITDYPSSNFKTDTVKKFGDLCAGKTYFRIGKQISFSIPGDTASVGAQTSDGSSESASTTTGASSNSGDNSTLPNCNIINGWLGGEGTFVGCLAYVAYYGLYWPIKSFAWLMGTLFDFFLGYSLADTSYRADFAVRGWQLVRDISNIFFIIILVWTGLTAVFTNKNNIKSVLPTLILNALLINFSLFAVRVVVDISNITARIFYSSMEVCNGACVDADKDGKPDNIKELATGVKPLSEKIMAGFNPQNIFSTSVLNTSTTPDDLDKGGVGTNQDNQGKQTSLLNSNNYATLYIIVSLIAAGLLLTVGLMFWKVAFFFLGRIIGLYITMIFAPFAFLTRGGMPLVSGIKELSWDNWVSDLFKYSFLAPIFVFFLYIIYIFIQSDFVKVFLAGGGDNQGFFRTIINVSMPMLILYFLVRQGVDLASDYAGKIGKAVQGYANKVVGAGVGIASGGVAFAGRNVLGRGIRALGKRTGLQNWAARNADNSLIARTFNQGFNRVQTGSWDVRNLGVKIGGKEYTAGSTIYKNLDITDVVSDKVGLGSDKALGKGGKAGGIIKIDKDRLDKSAKRKANRIKYDHLSDDEAKAVWEDKKKKATAKYGQKHWEDHVDATDQLKPFVESLKNATDAMNKAERDLDAANKNGTIPEQVAAQAKYHNAKTAKEAADRALEEQRISFIKTVNETSDKTVRDRMKQKAVEEAEIEEKKRLDRYGNIKNVSALEIAMRAEYAEDLRKNSFWLKDGKSRYLPGMLEALLGKSVVAGFASAIAGVSTVFGIGLIGDAISGITDNLFGDINNKATKKLINDALKSQGRGSAERQLTEKIEDLKKKVVAAAKEHGFGTSDKFDDYETSDLEEAILKKTVDLEDEIRNTTDKYEKRRKQKLHDDLVDALEEIERKQEKLNKMKEGKEKKNEDGDKKKEEGSK